MTEPDTKNMPNQHEPSHFFTKKSEIIEWLEKMDITEYTIHKNLVVDVHTDVDIDGCFGIKYLPVQFGHVRGHFKCKDGSFLSLKGCPHTVIGNFNCSHNQITSLVGGPLIVDGNYICSHNQLVSLQGCARKVDEFDCSHNKLTNLEHGPEDIEDGYDCSENQLTTLKHSPEKINGSFDCSHNKLPTLEGGPKEVSHNYQCMNNKLTSFQGLGKVEGEWLMIFHNPLSDFTSLDYEVAGDILLDDVASMPYLKDYYNSEGIVELPFSHFRKMIKAEQLYDKLDNEIGDNPQEDNTTTVRKLKI
jgi:hypothetical protein